MLTNKSILSNKPLIIAGPCAVESRRQILEISQQVAKLGAHVLRAQLWKPRTSPGTFQGVGEKGVVWLEEVRKKIGLPIAMEVGDVSHIDRLAQVAAILWVGARNMQNYELLRALGKDRQKRLVILKRGLIANLKEWLAAADYIGRDRVILCERGIRTGADSMRFTLDLNTALAAKFDHHMPVVIDPSHTAGRRDMVPYLAAAGIAAGMDGIIVEVHSDPDKALSDAEQQITPEVFKELVKDVRVIWQAVNS